MKKPLLLLALLVTPALADSLADDAYARIVAPGAKIEKLAGGFGFVEGPTWNERGFWVFSDISANTLYRITPKGKFATIRKPTGNSNGNAYDLQGRLISCEHTGRRVSRKTGKGTFETLASRFEGKRLNSPNDLAIKSDGSIYFTDPTYGITQAQRELGFQGLYRLFPSGKLELLDKDWEQPNGIAFSPDEKTLYVGDSEAGKIFRFDVDEKGALANKTLLATIPKPGDPDGMKVDGQGRLLVAGPGGVWVFAPRGGLLGVLPLPKVPANLSFGGADGKTLLMTARDTIYSVRLRAGAARPN
ncbi:SMP-30/gluconolactonase/LRE family protein [bacterium]|nr:MAG: SMP-30/gluconolactonase/LRE family protein [bacterium]